MKSDDIRIFDTVSKRFIDILQVVLLDAAPETHLPELYEIFGKDQLLKFLDIFSGTTFQVPERSVISDAVRDVSIYIRLSRTAEGARAEIVKDLATEYNLSPRVVRSIFYAMEQRLQRFKLP